MRRSLLLTVLVVLLVVFATGCAQDEEGAAVDQGAGGKGLVAHFAFEGNLEDSTANFAVGELIGTLIGESVGLVTETRGEEHYSVSYGEGVEGQAVKFDGSQGVLLPSGLIDGNTYTISLWIKPEALTMHTTALFGGANDSKWISIVPSGWSGGDTMLWSGNVEWYDAICGEAIPLNEWTHLVVSVDGGYVRVFLDGTEKFAGSNFPDVFSGAEKTIFALAVNWWDTPFIGMLDELKIYNQALTPSQI